MHRILTICLLATAFAPLVGADPTCAGDTCANVVSSGDGCDEAGNDDAVRAVTLDSGPHHASASSWCYVVAFDGYSESGQGLGVNYYSYDEASGEFRAAGVQWYGYAWEAGENGGAYCQIVAYSFGLSPLPDGSDGVDCLAGTPPLLPALP
jgi:hypothetical protein